jgi:hypothetical protein
VVVISDLIEKHVQCDLVCWLTKLALHCDNRWNLLETYFIILQKSPKCPRGAFFPCLTGRLRIYLYIVLF